RTGPPGPTDAECGIRAEHVEAAIRRPPGFRARPQSLTAGAPRHDRATRRQPTSSGLDQAMRVQDELLGRALVEVLVALRSLVEGDHGGVDRLGDLGPVV